jgi:hypothetical protein
LLTLVDVEKNVLSYSLQLFDHKYPKIVSYCVLLENKNQISCFYNMESASFNYLIYLFSTSFFTLSKVGIVLNFLSKKMFLAMAL